MFNFFQLASDYRQELQGAHMQNTLHRVEALLNRVVGGAASDGTNAENPSGEEKPAKTKIRVAIGKPSVVSYPDVLMALV